MKRFVVELPVMYEMTCTDWGTHYPHMYGKGYVCPGAEGAKVKIYRLRQPGCNYLVVDESGQSRFVEQAAGSGGRIVEVTAEPAFTMVWQGHRQFCEVYHTHLPHHMGGRDYCPGWSDGSELLIGEQVYLLPFGICYSKFVIIAGSNRIETR